MKKLTLLTIALLLLCIGTYAGAATVSYIDSIAIKTTNWTDTLDLQKFDTSLGTLNSAVVEFDGGLFGSVWFQNVDAEQQNIKLVQSGNEVFTLPDSTVWNLDYQYSKSVLLNTDEEFTADPADITKTGGSSWTAPFGYISGPGTFTINVAATGFSGWEGPANLNSEVLLSSKAFAKVTYDYTPKAVPEGSTLVGLFSSFSCLLGSAGLRSLVIKRRVK